MADFVPYQPRCQIRVERVIAVDQRRLGVGEVEDVAGQLNLAGRRGRECRAGILRRQIVAAPPCIADRHRDHPDAERFSGGDKLLFGAGADVVFGGRQIGVGQRRAAKE